MRRIDAIGYCTRAVLLAALAATVSGVGFALLTPPRHAGLSAAVDAKLASSGTGNPVTAVLLNFRGYDTLLEICVLTAAFAGVWALGTARRVVAERPSPVLVGLVRVLAPLFPLICGYLLWAGASQPGGAFQAGAVLATAAVLYLLLRSRSDTPLPGDALRAVAVAGPGVFLVVALGVMATGAEFLEYPVAHAGTLILLVETAATVSIAAVLAGLFLGGRPGE